MTHWIQRSTGRAFLLVALFGVFAAAPLSGQEEEGPAWSVGFAGELTSQFIWRGLELHDGPSFQPDVWLERGNVAIGIWSSWALDGEYHEVDTYISWYHELPVGELTLLATDYFYPKEDFGFFEFGGVKDGEPTGGHTVELGAQFSPSALPLTFELGWNAYGDPDKALFGGVGTEFSIPMLFDVGAEAGFLLNDSPWYYEADAGQLLDYRVSVSRGLSLGNFEPYVSAAVVRSALMEKTYWVFAVGF